MGSDWQFITLKEAGKWLSGGTPSKTNPNYWSGNIPWISAKSMYSNRLNDSNLKITKEGLENGSRLAPKNATLILVRGSILHQRVPIGISTREVAFNQDVKAIIPQKKFDPLFFFYSLAAQEKELLSKVENTGIGAGKLDTAVLHKMLIPCPRLNEQRLIAQFIGTLDDKIELNRKMNATLEAMAQALFKSWFVDFDPVIDNALAAGNAIPETLHARAEARKAMGHRRKPLPQAIQRQFPNCFVFTEEMGWIPEGWEVKVLSDLTTELRRGISPKYIENGGVRVINQKCIRKHVINFEPSRRNDHSQRKVEGRLVEEGDVLVNSTGVGTLGRIAQIYYLDEPTVVDTHVTVVRPNSSLYCPYTFGRMMLSNESTIESLGKGSTGQTELSRTDLEKLPVILPDLRVQKAAEISFQNFASQIAFNTKQNNTLVTLRDTLLPKLLSGKLRLPDSLIEKFAEQPNISNVEQLIAEAS